MTTQTITVDAMGQYAYAFSASMPSSYGDSCSCIEALNQPHEYDRNPKGRERSERRMKIEDEWKWVGSLTLLHNVMLRMFLLI